MTSAKLTIPHIFSSDPNLAACITAFFNTKSKSPHTLRLYLSSVNKFSAWFLTQGISDLHHVHQSHVIDYMNSLRNLSPATRRQHYTVMMQIFKWLTSHQIIDSNPADLTTSRKEFFTGDRQAPNKLHARNLSLENVKSIVNSIDTSTSIGKRDLLIIQLIIHYFFRVGELIHFKIADLTLVDNNSRTYLQVHRKNNLKMYYEIFNCDFIDYLSSAQIDLDQGNTPLFRAAVGGSGKLSERGMSQADVFRMINRRSNEAGVNVKVGCNALRSFGISQSLVSGNSFANVAKMMGHVNVATTLRYYTDLNLDDVNALPYK